MALPTAAKHRPPKRALSAERERAHTEGAVVSAGAMRRGEAMGSSGSDALPDAVLRGVPPVFGARPVARVVVGWRDEGCEVFPVPV
ncbi:hypothetical protein NS506_05863 [Nocardia seriolae]|nr:hypothetical protein NS506_05863 [Nocardia seriolae]BEK94795.1 hypothetical protein NSER024013_27010 [Nocardia seriolae]